MPEKPLVTVIIPVYNVERFLRRCLDSVLRQSFQNWHAVCVNDGSPDNSLEILQEYAMRDPRFEIINKKNGGLSDARNTGMKYARGEYILFLDSDDFIHDQTLELMIGAIKSKRADMAMFNFDVPFYKDLKRLLNKNKDIYGLVPTSRRKIYKLNKFRKYVTKNILTHCTERNRSLWLRRPARVRKHCYPVLALYKKDLIKDIPFIKGIIIEDFPWWVAVLHKKPKTVITKLPLYFYIPNATSILNSSKSLFMAKSIATGLRASYDLYSQNTSKMDFLHFNYHFLWPFTVIMMRKIRDLDNDADVATAKEFVSDLYNHGVFNRPRGMRARRYKRKILDFIK